MFLKKMANLIVSSVSAGHWRELSWLLLIPFFLGCPEPPQIDVDEAEVEVRRPDPIAVLVVDDAPTGERIARQWSARRNGEIKIVNQTSAQMVASDYQIEDEIDVVIYPTGMLIELESRGRLLPVSKALWSSEELNKDELLRLHRSTLVRVANEIWAVPLGSPLFSLMYNREFFAQQKIEVPDQWSAMLELADKIRSTNANSATVANQVTPSSLRLPLAESWAAEVFLARVGPEIRSRGKISTVFERSTMQPLITEPPFIAALEDLQKIVGDDQSQLELTPAMIYSQLLSGKTAIGMTWPSRSNSESENPMESENSTEVTEVGFANLPGARRWYDSKSKKWFQRSKEESRQVGLIGFSGLSASVASSSRNTNTGFEFLGWLASKPISLIALVDSPLSGPFRESHLGDPSRWTGTQISDGAASEYADLVKEINSQEVTFLFPRIPGRQRYLDALDRRIRSSLRGEMDAEMALKQAATDWEAITDELGRERLIGELRKDAGL